MPRANRNFMPGYVLHITHRCHKKEFLLKFVRDRQRWRYWLFEAKKRYGLCVLNYIVTSNHIHLLVQDRGRGEIAKSMQLIAGRTAQEYNQRKNRKGAFWEDRYHATLVDTDSHLARCMTYIDLNMVRAGAVAQPLEWDTSGFREIQVPPDRYRVIDQPTLMKLFGFTTSEQLRAACLNWSEQALAMGAIPYDSRWTDAIAVGSQEFLAEAKAALGVKALHRYVETDGDVQVLRESALPYTPHFGHEMHVLRGNNQVILER
ncbi:MAG: transposase [Gammaproteobacteria bacterium]|nr:transposase [Gammaproteobacteria bacterium]